MPNSGDDAAMMAELTYNLLENCQEKQEYIAEKLKLSVSEFKCLRSFRDDPTLSVKDIAQRMHLTSSRLTRILDGLVAKGFVTRTINDTDRRIIDVSLTTEGRQVARRLNIDYVDIHRQILDNVQPGARAPLLTALQSLSDAMRVWMKR